MFTVNPSNHVQGAAPYIVTGALPETFAGEDWKQYGFTETPEDDVTDGRAHIPDWLLAASADELQHLNQDELAALKFYSSENYDWVNSILYGAGKPLAVDVDEVTALNREGRRKRMLDSAVLRRAHKDPYGFCTLLPSSDATEAAYIINNLDTALTHGAGVPRIVYRGVGAHERYMPNGVDAYVEEHLQPGASISYKGYQSSTASYVRGEARSVAGGIIFEILTPAGVNISSISDYGHEQEVLLPRDSTYTVVSVDKIGDPAEVSWLNNSQYRVRLIATTTDRQVLTKETMTPATPVTPAEIGSN